MTHYTSMTQVKNANAQAGQHFFDASTLRFFRSRIGSRILGGCLFITSEQFDYGYPRLYTIRKTLPNGHIDTVGEFQQYATHGQASRAAERLAREEGCCT
jgi:hypothetical protein